VLLTRSPVSSTPKGGIDPRLACVRPAASVHPEPGSNSPLKDQKTTRAIQSMQRRTQQPPHTQKHASSRRSFITNLHYQRHYKYNSQTTTTTQAIAANGVVSPHTHPKADMRHHWLLAPCAVLKERPRLEGHNPNRADYQRNRRIHRLLDPSPTREEWCGIQFQRGPWASPRSEPGGGLGEEPWPLSLSRRTYSPTRSCVKCWPVSASCPTP
jgi:hypothetical protein